MSFISSARITVTRRRRGRCAPQARDGALQDRDHVRLRPALPALHRPAPQGRCEHRESLDEYLSAARHVGSDFEHARVIKALVAEVAFDGEELEAIIESSARDIGSDFELSSVLVAIARHLPDHAGARAAYEDAARSLSQFEEDRAMRALRREI